MGRSKGGREEGLGARWGEKEKGRKRGRKG